MGCRIIDLTMSVVLLLLLCLGVTRVKSGASDHRYKPDETVPLYVNKIGPFHNPR